MRFGRRPRSLAFRWHRRTKVPTGGRAGSKHPYTLLVNSALADSPFVVVVGERHPQGIKSPKNQLAFGFFNHHCAMVLTQPWKKYNPAARFEKQRSELWTKKKSPKYPKGIANFQSASLQKLAISNGFPKRRNGVRLRLERNIG